MDGKGDREVARKLWSEAQQAKIDVSALLPELGTRAPASLPVEIPPLTSMHAQAAGARQLGSAPGRPETASFGRRSRTVPSKPRKAT